MIRQFCNSVILLFCLLCLVSKTQAQTFIVSNLGSDVASSSLTIDSDNWRAQSFTTGSADNIYTVTDLTISTDALGYDHGTGTNFIYIYDDNSDEPGSRVGQFDDGTPSPDLGFDPIRYTFDAVGDIELLGDMTYWLVFGATGGIFGGQFGVDATDSDDETMASWSGTIGDTHLQNDGEGDGIGGWVLQQSTIIFGLEGTATLIPEPSIYAFLGGLLLIAFAMFRQMKIAQTAIQQTAIQQLKN